MFSYATYANRTLLAGFLYFHSNAKRTMGDLNWTKTSLASSLVRSEAFWCTVLGPEAERQESSRRGEAARREGGTSIVPQCSRIVQKRPRRGIRDRSDAGTILDVSGIHERLALRMKVPINGDGEGMSHNPCRSDAQLVCCTHADGYDTRISNIFFFFWTRTIFFLPFTASLFGL